MPTTSKLMTMPDSRRERAACPLYTAIGVIEGRWKPMLYQRLAARPHGFGELRRAMPGVASKVLREQLRQMQADGLVARRVLSPAYQGVRYRLTPYGRTLGPVFTALWRWGTRHLARTDTRHGTRVALPRSGRHRVGDHVLSAARVRRGLPMLIHDDSLSRTVDAVNEAFFFGRTIPANERRAVARWIASRQGLPGAYGRLFAGFESERTDGIRLFTGEHITSASARHVLGEESCRALLLLDGSDPSVAAALTDATKWMIERVEQAAAGSGRNSLGTFCCGKCTVGMWRNILAGGLDRRERRLAVGLAKLRAARTSPEGWRAFPFWYTVLALTEMNRQEARAELRYAAARIEAEANRPPGSTAYARRRNALARRALEQI